MPRVPVYEGRQVREQIAPNARITATASPETFGAGVGRGLQAVGGVFEQVQDNANRVAFMEADSKLSETQLAIEMDAISRKGKDAFELPNTAMQSFEKQAADIEKGLSTNAQKQAFQRALASRKDSLNRKIQGHVAREISAYDELTTRSYLENSRNAAIENANDPDRRSLEIARQVAAIRDHGQRNGLPAEEISARTQQAVSASHAGIIERMLANGKDISARGYLDEYRDEISGEHLARVEKAVEAGSLRFESQRRMDAIVAKHDDRGEALAEARTIEDANLRDATVKRVDSYFSDKRRADDERRQAIFKQASDKVEQAGSTDAIPPGDWTELSLTERQALERRAAQISSGKEPVTDWTTYTELRDKAVSSPNKFAKENLIRYRDKLADAEYKELVKLQKSVKEGDTGLKDAATLQQQLSTAHNIMDWDAGDRDKKGQFNQAVYTALNAAEQAAGKKLSFDERQKIIDRMLIEGEVERGSFFLPDPDRQFFEVAGTSDEAAFVPDVPDDERQKIEDALKRHNRPVTDEMVLRLYQQKVGLQ